MAKKRQRPDKPPNGEGRGFNALISFNPNEPGERRAREFARRLSKTKKLSGLVKGILDGLAEYEERTGVILTPERIIGLMFSGGTGQHNSYGEADQPDIVMTTENKAGAGEIANNFTSKFTIDDDDDIWDD